ncbi:MAG: hypothetical protein ACR2KT_11235 [Methylocella sp.]|nr:MAG: hypothetical protein DLM68_02295 [Hyphomicrobiales bacterium]
MNYFPRIRFGQWRWVAIATLPLFFPTAASAQYAPHDSFRELESKYIFGFAVGSDIGAEGEREIESETNFAFQKRTGSNGALEQVVELEYNPTDSFQIEPGARGVSTWIGGVVGLDDRHGADFGGLSSAFRYLLIGRGPGAPVGLQIAVEPEWSRVNDAGKLTTAFGAETSIIADTELVPNRLFAAFNATYTPEIAREFGTPDWQGASTLGLKTALTYRITPNVALGGELEYFRAFDGAGFNRLAGDVLFAGPTCFILFTNKLFLSAAFSTQIAGHAAGDANLLDLTNFTRNKARLKFIWEF